MSPDKRHDPGGDYMGIVRTDNTMVWWQAVLAFLGSMSTATALAGVVSVRWSGLFMALVTALNAATAVYIGQTKKVKRSLSARKRPGGGATYVETG